MSTFEDLKLGSDLLERLHGLGYHRPTALQEEAVPVIARGTTVMGVASAGSGKTLAYGLGLAARLDPASKGPQALILRPTDDGAAATADALLSLMQARGLTVAVVQARSPVASDVVVASPSAALAAVEHSAIKLDALSALVVDGASAMVELGAEEALETLTAQIPKDAQRVFLTPHLTRHVEDMIERHARRARRLAYIPKDVQPVRDATVEYWAAPRQLWLPVLLRLLDSMLAKSRNRCTLRCRLEEDAATLVDRLTVRGVDAGGIGGGASVQVECGDEAETEPGASTISWGSPADLQSLSKRIEGAARTVVFLEPGELAHLKRLAGSLGARLAALKTALPVEALRSAQLTREQLRDAAAGRDLEPYMLILEPLLDEFTPVQLAAAATALFRERSPAAATEPLPAWTRLYFGVGRRDDVRPADLVGAITGESSVSGDRIGRIEIRDTHSSVEVAASAADQVIKSLATATIRGRPANVRVFRE
jgi:ATP-dependent RNA helicase DeaD